MKKTALELFPIKTFVSLNSGLGLEVLDVRKSFARLETSVEGNVNLDSSAIILMLSDYKSA